MARYWKNNRIIFPLSRNGYTERRHCIVRVGINGMQLHDYLRAFTHWHDEEPWIAIGTDITCWVRRAEHHWISLQRSEVLVVDQWPKPNIPEKEVDRIEHMYWCAPRSSYLPCDDPGFYHCILKVLRPADPAGERKAA